MRARGKITFWNDEKGCGFIESDPGDKPVFVQMRSLSIALDVKGELRLHAGVGFQDKVSVHLESSTWSAL